MMLKKTKSKLCATWIRAAFGVLALLLAAEVASAAPCDIKSATPIIMHDLDASYCELCGTGYVTIVIANPYEGSDMTGMTVEEDLRSSGLTFDSSVSPSIWINGTSRPSAAPIFSGPNNSILTWDSAQIAELSSLAFDVSTITITFAVTRDSSLSQEGLITDPGIMRDMEAEVTYTPVDTTVLPNVPCPPGVPISVDTGVNTLQLREPDPAVTNGGRNVDAAQTSYTSMVYGSDSDDVIWRVRVTNNGDADLQDLELDDVMANGNIDINFLCSTWASAETAAITNNGSTATTPAGCVNVSGSGNDFTDYDVDDPFGYDDPGSDLVDVLQSTHDDIFLVGKIPVSAPGIGACSVPRTNTVSDIQWGCEAESANPGGIDRTTTGSPLADVTATLSTQSDNDLDIVVRYLGINKGDSNAGARGRVRITIENNSGGTVTDLSLQNDLPPEYVVDAIHPVSIKDTGAYGYYPGLTDLITWDNQNANPLLNKVPESTLTSSESTNSGQSNLLRHGQTGFTPL